MTRAAYGRRELLRRIVATSGGVMAAVGLKPIARVAAQSRTPDWTLLQNRVQGSVTPSNAAEYESRRRAMAWNAIKPARFPAAIVRATSDADVREAIRFARQHHLKVAIRGGGHNWHNAAIRQGGLLIDLSGLTQVEVDAPRRRAVVQPGVMGAVLIGKLAPHGLAFPVANGGQVGLSGFLLNGGLGRNSRVWGPACASVDAVDMVDASGESLHADRNQNTELFWAVRGAGPGFFGVVTRFYLNLHSMPRAMMRSTLTFAREGADTMAAWLARIGPFAPAAQVSCGFFNGAWRIAAVAFTDTISEGHDALQPLETEPEGLKALTKRLYQESSVETIFGSATDPFQEGPRYVGDSMLSDASPRDLVAAARDATRSAPAGSAINISGALGSRSTLPDMAFSVPGSTYVHAHALGKDPLLDATNDAWVRTTIASLEPLRTGYYVGEADLSVAPDRAKQCFSPAAWEKLAQLKRKYDPEDLFFSYLP